jgi:hypothetical protein
MSALPPKADSLFRSDGSTQPSAKRSVALDVPLTTHGFAAGFAAFGIEQNPFPSSSRLGTESRIVLLETSLYVSRPADIGSAIILALASQHINEEGHFLFWQKFSGDGFFLRQRRAEIRYLTAESREEGCS